MQCRLIGIIEGDKRQRERNDRILAIEEENHSYAKVRHIKDLGRKFVDELEEFFVNYHDLSGQKYHVLDVRGPKEARRRLREGIRAAKKRKD